MGLAEFVGCIGLIGLYSLYRVCRVYRMIGSTGFIRFIGFTWFIRLCFQVGVSGFRGSRSAPVALKPSNLLPPTGSQSRNPCACSACASHSFLQWPLEFEGVGGEAP